MAAYTVAGPGITSSVIYDDLQAALDAADAVNQTTTAEPDAAPYGAAFVVPAMAIKHATPADPEPSSSSPPGDAGADTPIP